MLYIGLDDTDNIGTPGTGRLARELAASLLADYSILGITRHQLLRHESIPFTANNSCNVIHVESPEADPAALFDRVSGFVAPRCAEGSDPGLCVAYPDQVSGLTFGGRCQTEVVPVQAAQDTAAARNVRLKSLGGSPCGIIGALAGVCLAATGNDGRFIQIGSVRDLRGQAPLAQVLESGVARIMTEDGAEISTGLIETGDKIRPAFRQFVATLYVRPLTDNLWEALKVQ